MTGTALGFDYGLRRIGVAAGQGLTRTATALATVAARDGKPDWDAIGRLIGEWRPEALVVGLPRHMDGSEHPLAARVRRFGNQLHGRYRLPVHYVDERLSSREAETLLKGQGGRGKEAIDRLAAQLILQTWLEQQAETNHG